MANRYLVRALRNRDMKVSTLRPPMETFPSTQPDRVFRFGLFELSERDAELRKNGVRIKLQEQPFRVLLELVAKPGKVVSREDLQQKLWPADTFVDFDVGLNTAIRKLRQALNDDADNPHYVETLARRGYRFVAQVSETSSGPEPVNETAAPAPPVDASAIALQPQEQGGRRTASAGKHLGWYFLIISVAVVVIAALVVWRAKPRTPALAIEKRITANPPEAPIRSAVISPDGKYIAYADPYGLYVRHIDTGEVRQLALPKDFNPLPTGWYPDSTDLVVQGRQGMDGATSVWRLSILGGSPQKLMDDAYDAVVSPDGSRLLFVRDHPVGQPWGSDLWRMDSDGASAHRIVNASQDLDPAHLGGHLWSVAWSPTGKRIAYIQRLRRFTANPAGTTLSLWTRDTDGGDPQLITTVSGLGALCWAADGRLLYSFRGDASDSNNENDVWALQVDPNTGKPKGTAQRLSRGLGSINGLSVSANGKRTVFLRNNTEPQVFIAQLDRVTQHLSAPYRLTLDEHGNMPTTWTPDGKSVIFVSSRNGSWKIFKQPIEQTTAELVVEGRNIFLPRLTADGSEVLYLEEYQPDDPSVPVRIMRTSLAGGAPREVLRENAIVNLQCARSPSKLCLFSTRAESSTTFFSFDSDLGKDGEIAKITTIAGGVDWSLSPNGSMLAIIQHGGIEDRIRYLSLRTGVAREVVVKDWPHLWSVDWSADGAGLLIPSTTSNWGNPVLLFVDLDGKAGVIWEGEKYGPLNWAIPSPDGRHLALMRWVGENNVWMLENY